MNLALLNHIFLCIWNTFFRACSLIMKRKKLIKLKKICDGKYILLTNFSTRHIVFAKY